MGVYGSDQYAASLEEFGRLRRLEWSGGWILERPIPGCSDLDAMGGYPLFSPRYWDRLEQDLNAVNDLVSLVVVADPFGDFEPSMLEGTFNHGVTLFKRHHVVELGPPVESLASPHHRRNARKALQLLEVEPVDRPLEALDDWIRLYDHLIERHQIQGVARFSPRSFARLFTMSALRVFLASVDGRAVGMLLWLVDGDVAYYHLGAYDESGYVTNASFALFWRAIEWFHGKVRWLDLGAGAGLADGSGGLDRFKGGWANDTRPAYLCRHVFQQDRYQSLVEQRGTRGETYFPSYRAVPSLQGSPA